MTAVHPTAQGTSWWRTAVVYQIYPRSFCDRSGDGIGDLEGLRSQLDHLAWLGVDAVWLSPIYRSPMADYGYDVSDHTDVDPVFGDLAVFDALLEDAHRRGLRVLLDWVPNHTSDQHLWFQASRSSRTDPKRDWYVWRDPGPGGGPPNNWVAAFDESAPAWTFDERTGQYYLHLFLPQQPDLNWAHPEVEAAQHDVLRFWLDRGVDGFRADVVHLIGKDPALPDDPPDLEGISRVGFHYHPEGLHPLLRRIRAVLDTYSEQDEPGHLPVGRAMVGEVNLRKHEPIVACYGAGDELHLVFNFQLLEAPWDAATWRDTIAGMQKAYEPAGAWPTWVLSNHDVPRHRTRFGGSEARARTAAVVLLTLGGTPFVYAGEELGLEDAVVAADQALDPGGRDGCRAPLPWSPEEPHGWSGPPWLPWPPEPSRRAAAVQRADPASVAALYRRLLAARRSAPALQTGELRLLDAPAGVLAFERGAGPTGRRVLAGFADAPSQVPPELTGPADATGQRWDVLVSSDGAGEGGAFDGRLGPDRAVVLAPRP